MGSILGVIRGHMVSVSLLPFGEDRTPYLVVLGRGLVRGECLGMLVSGHLGMLAVSISRFFPLTYALSRGLGDN